MLGMFDPSGLQMATTIGSKNSQQVASLGEEKEDRLREIFARADRNGDGALSRSELILRLRKDEELAELLRHADARGDGFLNLQEFTGEFGLRSAFEQLAAGWTGFKGFLEVLAA